MLFRFCICVQGFFDSQDFKTWRAWGRWWLTVAEIKVPLSNRGTCGYQVGLPSPLYDPFWSCELLVLSLDGHSCWVTTRAGTTVKTGSSGDKRLWGQGYMIERRRIWAQLKCCYTGSKHNVLLPEICLGSLNLRQVISDGGSTKHLIFFMWRREYVVSVLYLCSWLLWFTGF
jgi:hypothetical protein